jgi:heptosyltransferase-3
LHGFKAITVSESASYRRALVIKLRHLGDVLLTTPVFASLARRGIEADALVYDDTRDMLSLNPHVANIHGVSRQWRDLPSAAKLKAYRGLYAELKAQRYDLIVHLTDHWHGAWLARRLKPAVAVAPDVRRENAWAMRIWRGSFSALFPLLPGNRRHTVEMHLDALRRIGLQPHADDKRLRFEPGPAAYTELESKLKALGLSRGGYLHIHPTSRWLFKTWPQTHVAQLIDALSARGERVVITAAPAQSELDWVRALIGRLKHPVVDLCGQLSLKELGALIAGARVFVGVDSVPMHMAAALGTPSVALFGPSGDIEWGPWQVAHRLIAANFPCRPCGKDGCGGGKVSDCLTAIEPSRVLAAIDELAQDR